MIAIWAALFIGLALGAVEVRRHQRATEALLVAGMRADAAGDAIDKDIEDAVIEAAELQMAAWFARGERA